MNSFIPYVKAYMCDCKCGWALEKKSPEICWNCGSAGPHRLMVTSQSHYKFVEVPSADEDYLFSDVNELMRSLQNET